MSRNTAVFGIYQRNEDVAKAMELLRLAGFRNTDVSVLASENSGNKDLALDKSTKAPEGAVAGASSGAVLGGALGWLVGIGTLAIPGLGPFIAAGPLMALLGGIGVGGTVGGVAGALIGAGTPEYEAKRYEGRVHAGHVLLSVHCDDADWTNAAHEILQRSGAEDISSTAESSADFDRSERSRPRRELSLDHEADFRRTFELTHRDSKVAYEELAPFYAYGFQMANDPRYRGRNFDEVESELRITCRQTRRNMEWGAVSDAVLYGWEQAGGKVILPLGVI